MGIFEFEDEFIGALRRLKESGFDELTAMSPIPLHEADHILGFGKSPVRRFTLAGTIIGAAGGFAMAVYVPLLLVINLRYLPVSARPRALNIVMVSIGAAVYISFALYTIWGVVT